MIGRKSEAILNSWMELSKISLMLKVMILRALGAEKSSADTHLSVNFQKKKIKTFYFYLMYFSLIAYTLDMM